jgi:hypothetical protein
MTTQKDIRDLNRKTFKFNQFNNYCEPIELITKLF